MVGPAVKESKPVVLLVDDEPFNIDVLRGILADRYKVKAATHGRKALEIATSENPPDLILLDVMMPEMSGHEVLIKLRENPACCEIPVIFVTGMSDVGDEAKGFELGAVDYITKPLSPPLVLARVATHLRILETQRKQQAQAKQLSRYLSPTVWKSLFEGKHHAEVGARRRKLSVFFSDIVSFTRRTDHLEPEQLTELLNEYLETMTSIAHAHGGTVDKFIGDAVMVFFGDPDTRGELEDASACIRMAFEMRDATQALAEKWEGSDDEPFSSRMGIATGYCTVGNFGSSQRMDYTIIGTTVNLASRLEGIALPGQILVSDETFKVVEDRFVGTACGRVAVKGFDRPVAVYSLDGPRGRRRVQSEGRGYRFRVDLDGLDHAERQELAGLLRRTLDVLDEPNSAS